MSRSSGSRPAVRRAAAGVLALGIGLLSACSGEADDPTVAAPGSAADGGSASSSAPAAGSDAATSPSTGGEAETETITAVERGMSIELDEDSFSAGSYTIEVVNEGDATHDLVVERDGEDVAASDTIGPGESTSFTVDLAPGEYVFYCSVGNHRAMGMEIAVTVS
ncbi:cupredoxin domain-containing protein [Blastococcus sp. SYSU D00820]